MFLIIFVVACYALKVILIGRSFYTDDSESYLRILSYDALYILPILILLILSYTENRIKFIAFRVLSLLAVVTYLIDFTLIVTLNSRLHIEDVHKFIDQGAIYLGKATMTYGLLFLFVPLIAFVFLASKPIKLPKFVVIGICISFLVAISTLFWKPNSVRHPFYINIVQTNLFNTHHNTYSKEFRDKASYLPQRQCEKVAPVIPSKIIVILFESWSIYHSAYFGNEFDWTPKLDGLAKTNIALKNFYANGFTTEAGLYSLFIGQPLLSDSVSMQLDGKLGLAELPSKPSVVSALSQLGYQTRFITSGDLSFLNKGQWLQSIGFEDLIGNNDFSVQLPRYLFDSVSDEVLFDRAYDELRNSGGKQLMVIENVTTHQPFIVPKDKGAVMSEHLAFQYTDHVIKNFIEKINEAGTLIIVLSDHRSMTPVSTSELQRNGIMAASQVPAFIMWNKIKQTVTHPVQQSDLLTSVLGSIQGEICVSELNGNIFPVNYTHPPKCVAFRPGDQRDRVHLRCSEEDVTVLLDGDQTRRTEGTRQLPVDLVNYLRLQQ